MVFRYQWVLRLGISRYQASPSPQTACISRVTPTRSPSTTQIVSRSDCKSIVSPPVNFLPRCTVVMHCRVRASLLSHDSKHKHALRTKDMTTTPWRRLLVHSCCLQAHDIIDEQGLVVSYAHVRPCARFSAGAVTMPWALQRLSACLPVCLTASSPRAIQSSNMWQTRMIFDRGSLLP